MDLSNGKLRLRGGRQRGLEWLRQFFQDPDSYPLRRRIFHAQRAHRHPATLSASRRRKLRRA